jgi:hypothetical protein
MDISRAASPVQSDGSFYESRKRKLIEDIGAEYEGSSEMDRGCASGPRMRREPKYEGETMRGRTRQCGVGAPRRAGRRNERSARRG